MKTTSRRATFSRSLGFALCLGCFASSVFAALEKKESTSSHQKHTFYKTSWHRDGVLIYEGTKVDADKDGTIDELYERFYLDGKCAYTLNRKGGRTTRFYSGGSGVEISEGALEGADELWLWSKATGAFECFRLTGELYVPVPDQERLQKRKDYAAVAKSGEEASVEAAPPEPTPSRKAK